jgi:hypothetical protein
LKSILGLIKSLKIQALAGQYDNPIPARFLAPGLFKIPAQDKRIVINTDAILGHKIHKRLVFAPCYSQSLALVDFKENHTLLWFKNPYKKNLQKTCVYS